MLVVVGIELEARAIRRCLRPAGGQGGFRQPQLIVRTVGVGASALARLEPQLRADGAAAVLVAVLAGGCAPSVRTADVIVASAVGSGTAGDWIAPTPWLLGEAVRRLDQAALPYRVGRLLTTPAVVGTPAAKAACWRAHEALAVDMESAHVLGWAARAGLPALAVRAVADGPDETLPPLLASAVGAGGQLRLDTALGWVASPALLGSAWRLWRRSRLALDRLARVFTALSRPVDP